ncbi:hypothetical protein J6V85_04120 [Candidatus Saccharibacteria bacterium]|nr:hypothetical protein [Candidatus Saccharibacteria bacterium]
MANSKSYAVTVGTSGSGVINFSWAEYQAYSDEEYKTDPKINFGMKTIVYGNFPYEESKCNTVITNASATYDYRAAISVEDIINRGVVFVYNDPYLNLSGIGTFVEEAGHAVYDWSDIVFSTNNCSSLPTYVSSYTSQYCTDLNTWELATNIPIFATNSEASQYIQYGDNIASAINNNVPSVEGRAFQITNVWTQGTWDANGFTPGVGATNHHRDVRGRIIEDEAGVIALYPEPGINDGGLIYTCVVSGTVADLEYSEDGITWIPSAHFPYNYFYRPRVDEVGTFKFALTFYTDRIPIFPDAETVNDYINGDVGIEEAINWPDISNNYPGAGGGGVPTGEPDDGTDWGNVYTETFFHNQYLLEEGAIREISNDLYDTTPGGIWEDIKKGLDMYGDNPMDAVMSLMYFPLDLKTVFSNTSNTTSIYFGGYQYTLTSHTAERLIYPDGYFECGGVDFIPRFRNWRDTKAMRVFIDLPYCGRYELDPSKYWGKHINVIYYIDTHTGGCIACLVEGDVAGGRNGKCLDQFNGQMAVTLPITLTDFSAYANSQISTLLGGGGQAVNTAIQTSETAGNAAALGSVAGIAGAGAGAAGIGAITAGKTVYGLMMNNINKFNQTRGGSTGMLNQYVNQKPTFIFIYPETDIPSNFNEMYGQPSNYGGTVMNFSGYFEAEQIKLNMPGATENEKEKARALLMNGVYINR